MTAKLFVQLLLAFGLAAILTICSVIFSVVIWWVFKKEEEKLL